MKVKFFWIFLLVFSGAVGVGFFGKGLFELWRYYQIGSEARAQVNAWEVVEISPSKYVLKAKYSFCALGEERYGETQFSQGYLLNRFAAEREIDNFKKRTWKVWFSSNNPTLSSLERKSPIKNLVYGLLGCAVFINFLYRFQCQTKEDFVES
jgi:hypothetical protein